MTGENTEDVHTLHAAEEIALRAQVTCQMERHGYAFAPAYEATVLACPTAVMIVYCRPCVRGYRSPSPRCCWRAALPPGHARLPWAAEGELLRSRPAALRTRLPIPQLHRRPERSAGFLRERHEGTPPGGPSGNAPPSIYEGNGHGYATLSKTSALFPHSATRDLDVHRASA